MLRLEAQASVDVLFYSALGVKDGRAYENLFKRAQLEPLNATDVVDGYKVLSLFLSFHSLSPECPCQDYIKPMLERGQRRVGERAKL